MNFDQQSQRSVQSLICCLMSDTFLAQLKTITVHNKHIFIATQLSVGTYSLLDVLFYTILFFLYLFSLNITLNLQ